MGKIISTIDRVGQRLAQPDILFFVLPLLMGLLVVGTLAQKNIGVYAAQKEFFGAFIVWLGPIPLPAGMSLMALFLTNLTAKFFFKSEWTWRKSGSLLAHFGVLLLILGGILTTLTAREGYVVLDQSQQSNIVTDYHGRNLVIREMSPNGASHGEGGTTSKIILSIPHESLRDDLIIGAEHKLPFNFKIDKYCFNCTITPRPEAEQTGWGSPGKFMMLNKSPANPQDETNMTGVEFEVSESLGDKRPQKFLTFDGFPKPPNVVLSGKVYQITIERSTRNLPFDIQLDQFKRNFYPGTEMERAFTSELTIIDKERGVSFPAKIEMNAPLRYRGYTIYQSSFQTSSAGGNHNEATILAVVENKGRIFPYLSSIIIAIGLIIHLVRRVRRSRTMSFAPDRLQGVSPLHVLIIICASALVCGSVLIFPSFSYASPNTADELTPTKLDYDNFRKIPVLHDGRIKPLDSLARIELRQLSGKDRYEGLDAIIWFARTMFSPAEASRDMVFKIENQSTRHSLGLPDRAQPYYSFVELSAGLKNTFPLVEQLINQEQSVLSADQKALLRIHEDALEYTQIMRSFSLLLPLNVSIPPQYIKDLKPVGAVNYLALKKIEPQIQSDLKSIISRKGDDLKKYNNHEQKLAMIGWQIKMMEEAAQGNQVMRVIRSSTASNHFVAPWEIVNDGSGGPDTAQQLQDWQVLAHAFSMQSKEAWSKVSEKLYNESGYNTEHELFYNIVNPFFWACILYASAFAIILLVFSFSTHATHVRQRATITKLMVACAIATMFVALMLQIFGIGGRIFILGRPPVGTLYESILFVGTVAPLFSILMEYRLKNLLGLLCAAISGIGLGLLALSMQSEGDNMKVLGAVLNTQFWLTVHVLCITIGYGWCLVTSLLAHLILCAQALGKVTEEQLLRLRRSQGTLALTALLFTTVGTILGGVWADQSWGRFWGWDPKENGALLIVLWLVWVLHGKIAGQIGANMASALYGFLSVIVGLAWIGVNLLGVGLHSYGFTEGLFWGLIVFALFEVIILTALMIRIRAK